MPEPSGAKGKPSARAGRKATGTVYAPESDVKITNTGSTYGGIAGRTVTFDNPGSFTQDVNVTNLVTTATLALYFRTAWTECNAQPTVNTNPMSGC